MRRRQWSFLFILVVCFALSVGGSIANAGTLVEYGGAMAYIPSYQNDRPNSEQIKRIVDTAVANQISGGIYEADKFSVERLKEKQVLYALLPGQGNFFTDEATVRLARSSEELNSLLQVNFRNGSLRRGLGKYEVQVDMFVAVGVCTVNKKFGAGTGKQYFLPVLLKQNTLFEDRRPITSQWIELPAA